MPNEPQPGESPKSADVKPVRETPPPFAKTTEWFCFHFRRDAPMMWKNTPLGMLAIFGLSLVFSWLVTWHIVIPIKNTIIEADAIKIRDLKDENERLKKGGGIVTNYLPILTNNPIPTPIRDDALRLVAALEALRSDWTTNNLSQNQELTQIRTGDYERWIVRVHGELFTHNRHSSNFDDVALLSGLGTLENMFRVSTNSMTNILSNITEDVKKLLVPPLNE
jgi:hypothetical protein